MNPRGNKDEKFAKLNFNLMLNSNFIGGLFAGMFNGIVFHPVDKAIYLHTVDQPDDKKPLFSKKYWVKPFDGLRTTFYQRMFSQGIYFTLQGELNNRLYPVLKNQYGVSDKSSKFIIGSSAGAITGFFSNGIYAVKYYTFKKKGGAPLKNAIEMFSKGGIKPFFKGINAGISRDMTFGACYEVLNAYSDEYVLNKIPKENKKSQESLYALFRFISAAIATTMNSPFNYARNMQFASPPHQVQPGIMELLAAIWAGSKKIPEKGLLPRLSFFQNRFVIGFGTARAALGMVTGQEVFNRTKIKIEELNSDYAKKI